MNLFTAAERAMAMDDAVWARHANPWSGWTRFAVLPVLALAIWSRVWLGWWALLPVVAVLAWTWLNPRIFPRPADFGHWARRGVLGERTFLARDERDIAPAHVRASHWLTAVFTICVVPFAWGLASYDAGWTVCGIVLIAGSKAWFVDRMVWVHVDETGVALGQPIAEPVY